MLVINDTNYHKLVGPELDVRMPNGRLIGARTHGGEARLLSAIPRPASQGPGHVYGATPFSQSTIDAGFGAGVTIPKSEWQARIKEIEDLESGCDHFCSFDPWDQNGIPYCWCNGGTQAASTKRVMQGHSFIHFSAASVGGPVSGYRSVGGWGGDTINYLSKYGAVDEKLWPNNAIKSSLDTAEAKENRNNHKVLEWIECETWDEQITCGLLGFPSSCDYGWWSHVVMGCRPVWVDGTAAWMIRNSWGDWGDKNKYGKYGFAVLQGERHALGDPCLAIRQVTAAAI